MKYAVGRSEIASELRRTALFETTWHAAAAARGAQQFYFFPESFPDRFFAQFEDRSKNVRPHFRVAR